MKLLKSLSPLLAALTLLTLLGPTDSHAKPRGRGWTSLGISGFGTGQGGCWETWTRKHWLWGHQLVNEAVPCPGGGIQEKPNLGVVAPDSVGIVRFDVKGSADLVFGGPVSISLERSTTYLGPILTYGTSEASLLDLTADGERVLSVRLKPVTYPESVRVQASHELSKLFTGPDEVALVSFSDDGTRIEKVHAVVRLEVVK